MKNAKIILRPDKQSKKNGRGKDARTDVVNDERNA